MENVGDLNQSLEGSPYLIANDAIGSQRAAHLISEMSRISSLHREVEQIFSQTTVEIRDLLMVRTRARFVFESNALELTGLPLAETSRQIESAPSDLDKLAKYLAEKAVVNDRQLIDVLGLHRANLFVMQLANEYHQVGPITEIDIRSLHAATVPLERFAGHYRDRDVQISGSDHVPPPPYEVPRQMRELVDWVNQTSAPPPLAATAAHSWLTIIHPFQDGNGRVARLLANLVLLRSGWPSLIVRGSDRLQYLDALSASDDAGNLLPLFDLFIKSINRSLKEMAKPGFAERLYEADLQKSPDAKYQLWYRYLDDFLELLRIQLAPIGYDLLRLRVPSVSTFLLLCDNDPSGNTWLAKIRHSDGRDLLLWLGFMSHEMKDYGGPEIPAPSIFISERDHEGKGPHPYLDPMKYGSPISFDEISIVPTIKSEPFYIRYPGFVVDTCAISEGVARLVDALERTKK